jgi:hypothetical protein
MLLKVSALASGIVLLDGKPIGLDGLEDALKEAREKNGAVWYYREKSPADASSTVTPAMGLIIKYALPLSLATTPDFADRFTTQMAQLRATARAGEYESGMPGIGAPGDVEEIFAKARRTAAGARGLVCLVVVRPDRQFLILPALPNTPGLTARAGDLERLIRSAVKRNIAVIAQTRFTMGKPGAKVAVPSYEAVSKAIPFFGLLLALSHAGHAVWMFDENNSELAAGCRDADVLIIDGDVLALLRQGWEEEVSAVMRNPNILAHDRKSYQLRVIRKVGGNYDHLEFPN